MDAAAILPWSTEAWGAEANRWIRSKLDDADLTLLGPVERFRLRPGSIHLTVLTNRGRYWFKENCPALRFEARLVGLLAMLAPGRVLEPLAIDGERGWMLTPDGGTTLGDSGASVTAFGRTLSEYGALQRALIGHADKLAATGLPILPAGRAGEHFEGQLHDLARLPASHPLHMKAEDFAQVARHRSEVADAADRLAEVPIPDSLQHNDLHPSNAFEPTSGNLRFFDFGDAVWSHPFCVLNVALYRVAQTWGCQLNDHRIRKLIDIYLDGWTAFAPSRELHRLVEPAMTFAKLHRYNSWHQLIPYMPEHELQRHADYAEAAIRPSPKA